MGRVSTIRLNDKMRCSVSRPAPTRLDPAITFLYNFPSFFLEYHTLTHLLETFVRLARNSIPVPQSPAAHETLTKYSRWIGRGIFLRYTHATQRDVLYPFPSRMLQKSESGIRAVMSLFRRYLQNLKRIHHDFSSSLRVVSSIRTAFCDCDCPSYINIKYPS